MSTSSPHHLIQGDGTFCMDSSDAFAAACTPPLSSVGLQYSAVAIMGPQSSGKSTLLNKVFGTSFVEMDAQVGRSQTTKGVWVSKSPRITDSNATVLVLDLEGSDGRERGEDDTNFEKQSALFALAVADVLLINLWCHDIGREHGSGKPLLRTVMQVNLRLFNPRKMTLLFVIRDRSPMTPLDKLAKLLTDDLNDIWESVTATQAPPPPTLREEGSAGAGRGSSLSDYFDVRFTSLPNYEERPEEFAAECVVMRKLFSPDCSECLYTWPPAVSSGEGGGRIPGDAFFYSASQIWDMVRSNKDLDLPAHRIMVATVRCDELVADCLDALAADDAWKHLLRRCESSVAGTTDNEGDSGPFDESAAAIGALASHAIWRQLASYSTSAAHLDPGVVSTKRAELLRKLADEAAHLASTQLTRLRARVLAKFTEDVAKLPDETFGNGMAKAVAGARDAYQASAAAMLPSSQNLVGPARSAIAVGGDSKTKAALPADVAATLADDAGELAQELEAAPGAAAAASDDDARFAELAAEAYGQAAFDEFEKELSEKADFALKDRVDVVYLAQGRDVLRRELGEPVMALLDECDVGDMWRSIRGLRASSVEGIAAALREVLELQLEAPEGIVAKCLERLDKDGTEVVQSKCLDASAAVASRARERFTHVFNHTADGTPVVWSNLRVNVTARATAARMAAARLIASYAILDLDGSNEDALKDACDSMEALAKEMARAAAVEQRAETSGGGGGGGGGGGADGGDGDGGEGTTESTEDSQSPSAAMAVFSQASWSNLAKTSDQLLAPAKARQLFKQCLTDTSYHVSQALATQEVAQRASSTLPPMWAIVAMLVLGADEFLAVVYNPLWLIVLGLFAYVIFRMYTELEVERELRNGGTFIGGMAIANKFPMVMKRLFDDFLDSLRQFAEMSVEGPQQDGGGGAVPVEATTSSSSSEQVGEAGGGGNASSRGAHLTGESVRERRTRS